jgi:sulfatase maturation enzyme AslB (radical SAM superfamily)
VVRKLSGSPVHFASLTNGSRLEGELADLFAHHGTWVRISIDGWDDESYSRYRHVSKAEFGRVMHNMEQFKKIGGACYLGVSLIIDRDNGSHIYEFLRRLKDVGVDSVKLSPCLISDNQEENNRYHGGLMRTVRAQIEQAKRELASDSFELFDAYNTLDEKFKKEYGWCPCIQLTPVIGADLNVYTCPDKAYNMDKGVVGSIRGRRFKDFWFSGKDKFFKVNPSKDCIHHCERNPVNRLILEYLQSDPEHVPFI